MHVHISSKLITSLLYTFYIGAVIIAGVVYYGRQWSLENAVYVVLYPYLDDDATMLLIRGIVAS